MAEDATQRLAEPAAGARSAGPDIGLVTLTPAAQAAASNPVERPSGGPAFAHPSEAEFARILDFYQLEWQYEPRSFPLRYAEDGRVIERFTPDFYLPELDLYIELTTLKQSLVTKKNRKLRRLRELYPDVRIKLLYNRDYRNLLFKYGVQVASKRPPSGPSDSSVATAEDGRAGIGKASS